jgi:hypothetical protein
LTIITVKKAVRVKRLLGVLAVSISILQAEPTVHFGLGGVVGTEYFTVTNPGQSAQNEKAMFQGVQLKAGYGDIRAYAVEFDVGYGAYDKNIFSDKDTGYVYFDISLIKAFDFDMGFYPFFKLGMGTGELEVRRTLAHSLSSGSFFGGLGAYVPIGKGFDLEASAIYRFKSWEDLDMIGAQIQSSSYFIEPYLGINYRF